MERYGYFGKIPSAKDFIFQGLPMRTTERWAGFIAEWLARGARIHRDDWRRHVLTSPVWRFALGKDIISPESWVGLLASSIDGAGRLFPFTAMVEIAIDPASRQPLDEIDDVLDGLEPAFLDFMEDGIERQPLLSALEVAQKALKALPEIASGASLLIPDADEQAVCLLGNPAETEGGRLIVHPGRTSAKDGSPALSVWWHGGTSAAAPARCVSRGMPQALVALPFFDGDWARHGWVGR